MSYDLSQSTPDGRARVEALRRLNQIKPEPTSLVAYLSRGELLIIGPEDRGLDAAQRLAGQLQCTVVVPADAAAVSLTSNIDTGSMPEGQVMVRRSLSGLSGHLGNFQATVDTPQGECNLAELIARRRKEFDLVLDLQTPPMIRHELTAPGYYAPGDDSHRLEQALDELPGMVGEFEKPTYYQYDPSICAHGRSGLTACTRCLDACPTGAISSMGDGITVDSHLCQGAGSCATACPSGAIRYRYPGLKDTLERLRGALKSYRQSGGHRALLLFHDAEQGRALVHRLAAFLPENCIPIEVEDIGSIGLDTWLSALVYGAAGLIVLSMPGRPNSVLSEIKVQLELADALLSNMGYSNQALGLHKHRDDEHTLAAIAQAITPICLERPAEYAGMKDKRTVIRFALDHLHAQAPAPRPLTLLPAGAPFGEVWLAAERCTLCMACVSQCPSGALLAGSDKPQLRFIEQNCVQCGLCARSCPEDAIGPSPRYLHDAEQRRAIRILKEEEPFYCIDCGKPFATKGVMERMTKMLRHHRMFQGEALRRIKMCEDCRVKSMFKDEQVIDVIGDKKS
ncbi:MAG: 4Fe-4S binding protein [Pseudomonadota bacterium]